MADPQGLVAWQEEKDEVEMKEEKVEKELLTLVVGVGMEMTSFLLKDFADVVR